MPSLFQAELAAGFRAMIASELGQSITYANKGRLGVAVRGLVSWPSPDEGGMPAKYPRLLVDRDTLDAAPAAGDTVTVDAVTYTVYGEPREKAPGIWRVYCGG